jgi:hypothetical protein
MKCGHGIYLTVRSVRSVRQRLRRCQSVLTGLLHYNIACCRQNLEQYNWTSIIRLCSCSHALSLSAFRWTGLYSRSGMKSFRVLIALTSAGTAENRDFAAAKVSILDTIIICRLIPQASSKVVTFRQASFDDDMAHLLEFPVTFSCVEFRGMAE